MLNTHRLRFEKAGPARYLSHLDLIRTLPRAFRRAGIAIKYTEGFNPHAAMSILLPLSVGFSSDCELLDFTLLDDLTKEELLSRLNAALPEGLRGLGLLEPAPKAGALCYAGYTARLFYDAGVPTDCAEALTALFERESLITEKKGKKSRQNPSGLTAVDLRPAIRSVAFTEGEGEVRMELVAAASLNPMLLVKAIGEQLPEFAPDFASYHREMVYDGEMKPFFEK